MITLKKIFAMLSKSSESEVSSDIYYLHGTHQKKSAQDSLSSKGLSLDDLIEEADIEYIQNVAVLDIKTPLVCAVLDGKRTSSTATIKLPRLPHAEGCRCVTIPLFSADEILEGKRPENGDKRGQVAANTMFSDWFNSQSDEFQCEYLGDLRYQVFKKGHSLQSFVDMENWQAYTDDEIRRIFNL